MLQGRKEFARQLRELGYEPILLGGNRLKFQYLVGGGRFKGSEILLGFEVPPTFSRNPPSGPHVSPRLLPLNPLANCHPDKVLKSDFGEEWEYWSRPYPGWRGREPVETYLGFIARLFETS